MGFLISSLSLVILLSLNLGRLTLAEKRKDFFDRIEALSYQKKVAPVGKDGPGSPVPVKVTTYFMDIHKIDDTNMDFTAHFYFREQWNDTRLMHSLDENPITLGNGVENIWIPDLFFIEERKGSIHQVTRTNMFCKIYSSGTVFISYKLAVKFRCPMDLRNYPHDTQTCTISAESYGYQQKDLELLWGYDGKHEPATFAEDIDMLNFDVTGLKTDVRSIAFKSGNYTSLQLSFTFKRKFGFFATRLYVPFIILVLLTSLSLWIRPEERSLRLALLLVILYLMVDISTTINSLTPAAPYTKASDVWIGFCESLVFAAFLEFIAVALIAKTEEDTLKNKGEILLGLDPEDKESKLKSPVAKVLNMFDARQGGARNSLSLRIDTICRVVFPVIFVLFNIIYWSVYCS